VVVLGCLAGCGGGGTSTPSEQPATAPTGSQVVEGRVFDAVSGPVAAATVFIWIELPDGTGYSLSGASGSALQSDADGHFTTLVPATAGLVITAVKAGFLQPCAVVRDANSGSFDVELVAQATLDASNPPPPQSATGAITTTGTVYEVVAGNRQPIAGAQVEFDANDLVVATTVSDRDGHYLACDVPGAGAGIFAGGAELTAQKLGFVEATVYPIDTSHSGVIDVEMKRQ
jgi:hypothetical protein